MADWKDFVEDNRERWGQFLDSLEHGDRPIRPVEAPRRVVLLFCPVCHSAFTVQAELQFHVLQTHSQQHVFLLVNGIVVRDLVWAERGVETLRLLTLGLDNAEVELNGCGVKCRLHASGDVDLHKHLPTGFEGRLTICVAAPSLTKQFVIYCRKSPEFNTQKIDQAIWGLQSDFMRHPSTPDVDRWRQACGIDEGTEDIQKRYVDGFFEYTFAFALEARNTPSIVKQHFEDAFGRLLPFRTALAEQAQAVLGMKMNCFAVLSRCATPSPFSAADFFFNRFPETWRPSPDWPRWQSFGVVCDPFTRQFPELLAAFYSKDFRKVDQGVCALRSFPGCGQEKNNEEKLPLLCARTAWEERDFAKAKCYYGELVYNPFFGKEATARLHQ